ncbi:MAG TPA: hypothetical protein PK990_10550 [Salinivirgaceae bacterium]|nr:hypothetical protein [Salinivirgaceae bacterium]
MATIKHFKKGVKQLIGDLFFECYVTEICAKSANTDEIRKIAQQISELNHSTKEQIAIYRKQKPRGKECKKYFSDLKSNITINTQEIVSQLEKIETKLL